MSSVDLSALPAPEAIEPLDFEQLYADCLSVYRDFMGDNWTAALESDAVVKLVELAAYIKLGNRARVNDGVKAVLLAYAKGNDLDQMAANVNLQRLVVQEADDSTVPAIPEVKESDDALKERVQLAYEGLSTAGPRNSYILHARNASGQVADATAESPSPATVVVTVLGINGTGVVEQDLLNAVFTYLSDDDLRPVGDRLLVQSAQVIPYTITAILHMEGAGSENETILSEARKRLAAWINPRRRLAVEVARSAIDAQLHINGVRRVELVGWSDILPTKAQAAYCTGFTVNLGD